MGVLLLLIWLVSPFRAQILCAALSWRVVSESFYRTQRSVSAVNICIIGCGAIGTTIARAVEDSPDINIVYLTDRSKECATRLQEKAKKVRYVPDIVPILNDIRLVVEAASQDAARYYVPLALSAGVDVLIMSVGVFQDEEFQNDAFRLAKRKNAKVYLPSGAIGGIDALTAASI